MNNIAIIETRITTADMNSKLAIGRLTFIPKKLVIIVGIIKTAMTIVNAFIAMLKSFDIIVEFLLII